jgi:hypothetical protein
VGPVDGYQNYGTQFIDGEVAFSELLSNGWKLPRTTERSEAVLMLVLRDERGGVGWAEHRFPLEASE